MLSFSLKEIIHISLSILTFSVLVLAALQALFLIWQEWLLRGKKAMFLLQILPPLQTMEVLLFRLVTLGFILLTVVLITSFCFFTHIFTPPLLNKTILALIAWVVFAILLSGRRIFGWRGPLATRSTLIGVGLVLLVSLGVDFNSLTP